MNHWLDVYRLVNDYDDIDIWVPHEFNEMAALCLPVKDVTVKASLTTYKYLLNGNCALVVGMPEPSVDMGMLIVRLSNPTPSSTVKESSRLSIACQVRC